MQGSDLELKNHHINLFIRIKIMKTILKLSLLISMLSWIPFSGIHAQKGEKKGMKESITIQSNAKCEMCVDRIQAAVKKVKGTKTVQVSTETSKVTVQFLSEKTNATEIRKAISEAGYVADDVAANPQVREKLPNCCK